jgi:hypothetical protein
MRSSVHYWAWAFAVTLAASPMLRAQELRTVGELPNFSQPSGHAGGRVLVLDNECVLQGAVERQGDVYVVRGDVGELKVPAAKALTICANLEDAYEFLKSRANLHDGNERLKLAHWCHTHGLSQQAIAETQASLLLRPEHLESKQFLAMLQRTAAAPSNQQPRTEEAPPSSDTPSLSVSSDCMAVFATKVQPFLMNSCSSCHATGRGGAFVLIRATDGIVRHATQANLTAAIHQINFDKPAASPLLSKACSPHGEPDGANTQSHAALANRQAGPFLTLQGWVELLVAQNRHLKAHGTLAVAALPPPVPVHPAPTETVSKLLLDSSPAADGNAAVPATARRVDMVPSLAKNDEAKASGPPAARPVEVVPSVIQAPAIDAPGIDRARQAGILVRVFAQTPGIDAPGIDRPPQGKVSTPSAAASPYDPTPFNQMLSPSR